MIKYKGGNKWEKSILSFRLHPVLTVQGVYIPQASHVLSPWLLQLVQGCDPNWISEIQFRDSFFFWKEKLCSYWIGGARSCCWSEENLHEKRNPRKYGIEESDASRRR